jgi:protein-L-isoaspartate O-methyltransferase
MSPSSYLTEGVVLATVLALFAVRARLRKTVSRVLRRLPAGELPAIEVRDRRGGRELWFEKGGRRMLQARIDLTNQLVSRLPYVDGLHLYLDEDAAPLRALFIGCGAGIGPRQLLHLHPTARVDVVDIDPRIFEVAAEFFDLRASERCALHTVDGRDFLARPAETAPYDRIIVDVFGANDMPAHLCTAEFFRLCREQLGEAGVCVVNTAGAREGESAALAGAIHAGLVEAFGRESVRVHAVPRGRERRLAAGRRRNWLLFGFRSVVPAPATAAAERYPALPALSRIAAHRVTFEQAHEPLRDASVGDAPLAIL